MNNIQEAKLKGFYPLKGYKGYVINKSGLIYNIKTAKYIKTDAGNYISIEGNRVNLPKLLIFQFKGIGIRNGQISYFDSDKTNLNVKNLNYSSLFGTNPPLQNNEGLLTAVRCYFEVSKKYNAKDRTQTHIYLRTIIQERNFLTTHTKSKYIDVFETYLSFISKSISDVALEHSLSVRDCTHIVNGFINLLINNVLTDLQKDFLQVLDYRKRTYKKSNAQALKEWNKTMLELRQEQPKTKR